MKNWIATGLAGFLLAGPLTLTAQEEGQRTKKDDADLDPVTITASISPEKLSRTGRDMIVLKGEKIYQWPVHSIDELLRYLPGVEVQSRGPMGSQSDFVLRGGTFQQVLVILDGVRLNDPNSGHFTSYIPIAPSEIERIEILKGASSALYGAEAVGGVINIVTKTFAAKRNQKTSSAVAQVTGGQYGLFNVNAGATVSRGGTSIGLGLLTNNATGQQQRGITGFFHNHTGSVSLSHYFDEKWQLSLRSSYDDRKFAAQNFYTGYVSDTASEQVKTLWNQLALTYRSAKDILSFSAGYKKLDDHYAFNPASTANQSRSDLFQAAVSNEWKWQEKTTLVSGVQFINRRILSNDRGDHRLDQAAVFALLHRQLGEHLVLSPAARMEWNQKNGWEFIPQLAFSYREGLFQLRGSAGKTLRDADFTERYNNYNKLLIPSGQRVGNPDLSPEHSFSYELGADLFISHLKMSGTYFQRLHKDLIDYVYTPYSQMPRKDNISPSGSFLLARNIAEVDTRGVETSLQFSQPLGKQQDLTAMVGLVWLSSTSSDSVPSLYISSHARYLLNYNLEYQNKWFGFSVNGLYKDRLPQSGSPALAKVSTDYFVLNARLEAFIIKNRMTAFAEADNLFDRSYTDLLGSQMPGRWLMGGIKISL